MADVLWGLTFLQVSDPAALCLLLVAVAASDSGWEDESIRSSRHYQNHAAENQLRQKQLFFVI